MIEHTFNVGDFSSGNLSTADGSETVSDSSLRTDFLEIPRGLQTFSVTPRVVRKTWNRNEQTYSYTEAEALCYAWFFTETQAFIKRVDLRNTTVDYLKYLGARYVRFTVGLVTANIYPDESAETTGGYYFLSDFLTQYTAVEWYLDENSKLIHENLKNAPEKSMTKPYPKALWRVDENISSLPFHGFMPLEKPSGAFMNAENLRYIYIPETVRKIGKFAFSGTALECVKIHPDCEFSETSFPENCIIKFYD